MLTSACAAAAAITPMAVERQQAPVIPGPAVGERARPLDPATADVYSAGAPIFKFAPGKCVHCGGFRSVDIDGDPVCGLCGRHEFVPIPGGHLREVKPNPPTLPGEQALVTHKRSRVRNPRKPKKIDAPSRPLSPRGQLRQFVRETPWNTSWSE
jgi:hypothetical protein